MKNPLYSSFFNSSARWLLLWLFTAISLVIKGEESNPKVLVLHSYHEGYEWTDDVNRGIIKTLATHPEIQTYVEYMDVIRFQSDDYQAKLEDLYSYRYGNLPIDVLLVLDDDAFDFIVERGEILFPGVPVVFAGVDNFTPTRIRGRKNFTGIEIKPSIAETVDLAMHLSPFARKLAVVAGSRLTERIFYLEFLDYINTAKPEIELVHLAGAEPDNLEKELKLLSEHDIVLYLSWMQTPSGQYFSVAQALQMIRKSTKARIFGIRDFTLPHGVIGGKVVHGYSIGEAAAALVLRVLNGEEVSLMPVLHASSNKFLFNGFLLEQYGISKKYLPDNSIIINRSPQSLAHEWSQMEKEGILGYEFFQNHGVVMLLVEPGSGLIVDANRAAYSYYGYNDVVGMTVHDINPMTTEELQNEIDQAKRLNKNYFSFQHILADSQLRDVRVFSYPVEHKGMELLYSIIIDVTEEIQARQQLKNVYFNILGLAVIVLIALLVLVVILLRNIREKQIAQHKLEESENRYRSLFNNIMDIVFSCDTAGRILQTNPVATEVFGNQKILGERIWKFMLPGERKKWNSYVNGVVTSGESRFTFETRVFNFRDEIIYLEINGFIKYANPERNPIEIFGIARNITEKKQLTRTVLKASIETEERERKRFAADLHDGIGPLLSGLKLYLQQENLSKGMNGKQLKVLVYCRQILDDAISQTRTIARNLAPGMVSDFGLEKALTAFLARLDLLDRCEINFQVVNSISLLNHSQNLSLYRVITELINNSLKYAECNKINILMCIDDDRFYCSFTDNGKGFDVESLFASNKPTGMGLYNMVNRINALDGQIDFARGDEGGLEVKIEVPLFTQSSEELFSVTEKDDNRW